jgi:hypothetical protein
MKVYVLRDNTGLFYGQRIDHTNKSFDQQNDIVFATPSLAWAEQIADAFNLAAALELALPIVVMELNDNDQ